MIYPMHRTRHPKVPRQKTLSDHMVELNQQPAPNPARRKKTFEIQVSNLPIKEASYSDKIDALILLKNAKSLPRLTERERLRVVHKILQSIDCSDVPKQTVAGRLFDKLGFGKSAEYFENVFLALRLQPVREEVKDCAAATLAVIPCSVIAAGLVGATLPMLGVAIAAGITYAGGRFIHDASDEGKLQRVLQGGHNLAIQANTLT